MLAVGFTAGPPADAVSALTPEEATKKALDQLDDMFRGRKWLEGGGCTGKGDWEEQEQEQQHVGDKTESKERDDLKPVQTQGVCWEVADGNPEGDELLERERDSVPETEKRECDRNSRDTPRPHDPAHGDKVDGDMVGGAKAEGEGAELPSAAYTGGLVHDWIKDEPFVRGGYSYPSFGFDDTTHSDAGSSVNGTLFFAGEHTNTPTGMTVHAAIDSGER